MSKKINVRDIKNRQKLLKTEFKHNFLRFKAIIFIYFIPGVLFLLKNGNHLYRRNY